MIRLAICDDEKQDCLLLKKYVQEYMVKNDLNYDIHIFYNGKDLLQSDIDFDLIFLDILMEKPNGIEAAKAFLEQNKKQKIFYISSSNAYLKEGYRVNAVRYITKPIDKNELFDDLNSVLKAIINENKYIFDETIPTIKIYLSDILFIEVIGRTSYIHTTTKIYTSKKPLKTWLNELEKEHFYKSHNAYLVNARYVYNIKFDKIILKDKQEIPLSRTYKESFKNHYYEYIGNL